MTSSFILSVVTFTYGAAAILYWATWVFKRPVFGRAATWISLLAVAGNTVGILLRWLESHRMGIGHVPLSNLYESLIFFAWITMVVYLVTERQYKVKSLGAFTASLAFLAMAYASLSPDVNDRIQPLIPALKSNWLTAHVVTCFLGYAAFAAAFGLGAMYLLKTRKGKVPGPIMSRLPEPVVIDELLYQNILLGFLFLSAGIITGAVWANTAWGHYWSWDPKETWSLVTWLVYAGLIHARMVRGWHGRATAIFSILGFLCVLFTWFGVNLLAGLHSYAT